MNQAKIIKHQSFHAPKVMRTNDFQGVLKSHNRPLRLALPLECPTDAEQGIRGASINVEGLELAKSLTIHLPRPLRLTEVELDPGQAFERPCRHDRGSFRGQELLGAAILVVCDLQLA